MNLIAILLLLAQAIPIPPRSDRVIHPPEITHIERGTNGCHICWKFTGDPDVFRISRKEGSGILMQRFVCPHMAAQTTLNATNEHTYSWTDGWPTDPSVSYNYVVTAFTATEFDLDSAPKPIGP